MEKSNIKRSNRRFVFSAVIFVLIFVLIALVKTFDVAAIGPEGTSIGFSHLNGAVHEFFGLSNVWYAITQATGIVAICLVLEYAILGLIQLISRKSFAKVDRYIYCLGGLFAVVFVLYALFEKVVINYRPIIEEGAEHVEASFPSSHTMLVCTVLGSVILILDKYGNIGIKNQSKKTVTFLKAFLFVLILLTVIGRLVCGVHWLTDILGGVLISLALLFLFSAVLDRVDDKK